MTDSMPHKAGKRLAGLESPMTLQNRVDPFGAIHADPARGLFTGNRGIIHDPLTRTLMNRRWTSKAWIICALEWKGVRREPMAGRSWTELFFADEVTALAAGHRPCFECRRESARAFQNAFAAGNGMRPANAMDALLHGQRLAAGNNPMPVSLMNLPGLPDGAMIASGDRAFALKGRRALEWTFGGYLPPRTLSDLARAPITLITPQATLAALQQGYQPQWHLSAKQA